VSEASASSSTRFSASVRHTPVISKWKRRSRRDASE